MHRACTDTTEKDGRVWPAHVLHVRTQQEGGAWPAHAVHVRTQPEGMVWPVHALHVRTRLRGRAWPAHALHVRTQLRGRVRPVHAYMCEHCQETTKARGQRVSPYATTLARLPESAVSKACCEGAR